jgi:hypothetical protein
VFAEKAHIRAYTCLFRQVRATSIMRFRSRMRNKLSAYIGFMCMALGCPKSKCKMLTLTVFDILVPKKSQKCPANDALLYFSWCFQIIRLAYKMAKRIKYVFASARQNDVKRFKTHYRSCQWSIQCINSHDVNTICQLCHGMGPPAQVPLVATQNFVFNFKPSKQKWALRTALN